MEIHNVKTLTEKLHEFHNDIGLTDDELMLIIYTSIDHDYLNNLLVLAGEFLMWFNLNFEGESREEIDFRENKLEIWKSTCVQAKMIIEQYNKMETGKEHILTAKWWSLLRYSHFGSEMAKKFEEKADLKTECRAIFKKQHDKLSYYDLFQFIEHKLQIKLESWEEDALEGRLDRLGMAFIEFNEFNEFSQEYGIDWGEELIQGDLEDILDAKLNLSYKDYKVGKKDYFQGCPSMLTSEKAALAKCNSIWQEFKMARKMGGADNKWLDPDFGPKRRSDLDRCKFTLYKTGEMPKKGMPDPTDVEFVYVD